MPFIYYVMPFIDGETLRDKLNRETQLSIDEAVKITTNLPARSIMRTAAASSPRYAARAREVVEN